MSSVSIHFTTGDATAIRERPAVIVHICNDVGGWGRGFVLAISKRWPQPEHDYRAWATSVAADFRLGSVKFVEVEPGLWVANMIAQRDIRQRDGIPPIRYEALHECLLAVADFCVSRAASVHMPRIGCGLAGGQWSEVEPIIHATLLNKGVGVTVYDFAEPPPQRGDTPKPEARPLADAALGNPIINPPALKRRHTSS